MVTAVGKIRLRWVRMKGSGYSRNMGQRCGKKVTWMEKIEGVGLEEYSGLAEIIKKT